MHSPMSPKDLLLELNALQSGFLSFPSLPRLTRDP
jgi:hypothetical protein